MRSEGRATGDLVQLRTMPYNLRTSLVAFPINGASGGPNILGWKFGLMNQPPRDVRKSDLSKTQVSRTPLALLRAFLCFRSGALSCFTRPRVDRYAPSRVSWLH